MKKNFKHNAVIGLLSLMPIGAYAAPIDLSSWTPLTLIFRADKALAAGYWNQEIPLSNR